MFESNSEGTISYLIVHHVISISIFICFCSLSIRYGMRRNISTSILSKKAYNSESECNNNWTLTQRRLYATNNDHKYYRNRYATIGTGIIIGLSGYTIYHLCGYNKHNICIALKTANYNRSLIFFFSFENVDGENEKVHALQPNDVFECHKIVRPDLPTYKMSEIGTHST